MKNWTIKEAVNVITAGKDQEAIKEIAKHFPMFFMVVAKGDLVGLANMMGEKFTVRRLGAAEAAAEDDEATEPAGLEEAPAETEATETDLEAMSTKELMKLCDQRGIKVPHYGKNKQFYLEKLQAAEGDAEEKPAAPKKPAKAKAMPEPEVEETEEDGEADPYEGMKAIDLYNLCKERGIKAAPKQKAAVYAELLRKADQEAEAEDTEDADDDWGDEEEAEEEKPAKVEKKAPAKAPAKAKAEPKKAPAKAPAKAKAAPAAEAPADDDDWDI